MAAVGHEIDAAGQRDCRAGRGQAAGVRAAAAAAPFRHRPLGASRPDPTVLCGHVHTWRREMLLSSHCIRADPFATSKNNVA